MNKKQAITGSIMIIAGIVLFLQIVIRFFLQGYFTNEQIIYFLIPYEMNNYFGTIIFSLLFAFSGYFLIQKKYNFTLFICQFIAIGVLIDRLWCIYENQGSVKVLDFKLPLLIAFLCILYFIIEQEKFDYKKLVKKFTILLLGNIAIISIGKFLLPNI